jgi:capsular polysaccharide biosynthesis protein
VGLAFLAERFSLALQSPEDVKALLELPVLAAFPKEISR